MKLSITIATALACLASAKDVCHSKKTQIGDCAMTVLNSLGSSYGCEEKNTICHCNSATKIRFDAAQEIAFHCGEEAMQEYNVPHHMWCKCVSLESHKAAMSTDTALIEARALATTSATVFATPTGAQSGSGYRAANQTSSSWLNHTLVGVLQNEAGVVVPGVMGPVVQVVGVLGLFAGALAYL